jgi:hypothetical protein
MNSKISMPLCRGVNFLTGKVIEKFEDFKRMSRVFEGFENFPNFF